MAAAGGCCASLMSLPCLSSLMGGCGCGGGDGGGGSTTCAFGATCDNICNFLTCCNRGNCCVTTNVGQGGSFAPSDATHITSNAGSTQGGGVDAVRVSNAANRAFDVAAAAAASSSNNTGSAALGAARDVTAVITQQPQGKSAESKTSYV